MDKGSETRYEFFHRFYQKQMRCTKCNELCKLEQHTCEILGRKIAVLNDETEGIPEVAQVIYFDAETNQHLLLYTELRKDNVEVVNLYEENVTWRLIEERKTVPLEEHLRQPENWERCDIEQLGITTAYLFNGVCMYYIKPSLIANAGNGAFAARRFEKRDY